MNHEYWCDLLSATDVKDDRKMELTHINKIASSRAASLSDSNGSIRIPRKKKARIGAGVLRSNKRPNNKVPKNHGTQCHYVLFKKAGILEKKYMLHSAEEFFGKRFNQKTITDGMGGHIGSRAEAVKKYKNSEKM